MVTSSPTSTQAETSHNSRRALITTGVILGVGQAAFFDGIIFHQLLQWHHMFSNVRTDATVAGLELNTVGDGLFHLFAWVTLSVGIVLLWRLAKQQIQLSTRTFVGALMIGAGSFNVIEGLIDHQILGIHHVKAGANQLAYDMSFLAVGAAVAAIGWILLRSEDKPTT